jgi:hypothetical protein
VRDQHLAIVEPSMCRCVEEEEEEPTHGEGEQNRTEQRGETDSRQMTS